MCIYNVHIASALAFSAHLCTFASICIYGRRSPYIFASVSPKLSASMSGNMFCTPTMSPNVCQNVWQHVLYAHNVHPCLPESAECLATCSVHPLCPPLSACLSVWQHVLNTHNVPPCLPECLVPCSEHPQCPHCLPECLATCPVHPQCPPLSA